MTTAGSPARRWIGQRDKIAASKRKGMWMGGVPPLGYRAQDHKLIVIDSEAELVGSAPLRSAVGSCRLTSSSADLGGG